MPRTKKRGASKRITPAPLKRAVDDLAATQGVVRADVSPRPANAAGVYADGTLRESDGLYRSFFALAPSGVVLNDADGNILAFNDQAFRLLGYTRDEFARLRLSDVDAHEQPEDVRRRIAQIVAAGGDEYEVEHRAKSGTIRNVLVRTRPVEIGGERRFLNVWQDITDRKRTQEALRESEERFRAFAECIPHVAFIAGLAGTLTFANGRFSEYFGMGPERVNPSRWKPLVHPEDVERTVREWSSGLKSAVAFTIEHRLRRHDGAFRWHATRVAPMRDARGEISMWAGTSTDIHDQREAASELAQMNEQLRESDRRKTEFLGVLSHELRNPLAPIRYGVDLLERVAPGSEEAGRARQVIRRQTEYLTNLVDDLLDVTRISRGKIELHKARVDVSEIARQTAGDLRSMFQQGGIELSVKLAPGPVWVDADRTRIAQVLGNLLQNAAKFTPRGGHVALSVAASGGSVELCVGDDGIGIAPEELERMFEPFAQADHGIARTKGGLGLGLALVKGLVELHGGRVQARSEGMGRGTEFVVSLPLSPAASEGAEDVRASFSSARRQAVVVIEDNVDAGEILAEVLRIEGHEVHVAHDGRSGLDLARRLKPDVVLCDIGLPDLDGYAIARIIRRDEAIGSTRLVALSGYAQPEDRQRAREAGFDEHIAKPSSPADVIKAITGRR